MACMDLVLSTSRLTLRPPVEADLDGWARFDADPSATAFFGGPGARADSWRGLATAAGMWALRGASLFSVIETGTGRWVGRVGPWIPEGALGTEIGWAIAPEAWGRGYATEAAARIVDWAFEALGWTDVIHCIDASNSPSIAVAERLGSAWLREDREADGKIVQIYGQTREQWRAKAAMARGTAP